jgi:hypothetical protein
MDGFNAVNQAGTARISDGYGAVWSWRRSADTGGRTNAGRVAAAATVPVTVLVSALVNLAIGQLAVTVVETQASRESEATDTDRGPCDSSSPHDQAE